MVLLVFGSEHVDMSDMRAYELICMISSIHSINIYVCHALVSCLTCETLTVQKKMTFMPPFDSHQDILYDHS